MYQCQYCLLEVRSLDDFVMMRSSAGHNVVVTKDHRRAHDFVNMRRTKEENNEVQPEVGIGPDIKRVEADLGFGQESIGENVSSEGSTGEEQVEESFEQLFGERDEAVEEEFYTESGEENGDE